MSNVQPTIPNETAGLLDLFDISLLWKRKWTLAFSVLLAAGAGAAYVSQETPVFEVTSRILVQMERLSTEKESLLRTDRTFLITQGELVTCPVVVQPALASLQRSPSKEPDYEATEAVVKALRVTAVDDANVLKLTYRSPDPQDAVKVLRAVVESYRKYVQEMQQGSIGETLQILTMKESDLRKELEKLENKYTELRKKSSAIGQGTDAYRNGQAMLLERANALASVQRQRIEKETKLSAVASLLGNSPRENQLTSAQLVPAMLYSSRNAQSAFGNVTEVASIDTIRNAEMRMSAEVPSVVDSYAGESMDPVRIQDRLWQTMALANQMSQKFGENHPEMKSIRSQVELWERRLDSSRMNTPVLLGHEVAALRKSEDLLGGLYKDEYEKVKELDLDLLEEQHTLADLQRVQSIFDTTSKQLRDLQLADQTVSNGQTSIMVRVIEPPDATAKLAWPRPPQFIGLCAVLGLAAGSVLVTLAGRLTGKR